MKLIKEKADWYKSGLSKAITKLTCSDFPMDDLNNLIALHNLLEYGWSDLLVETKPDYFGPDETRARLPII